MTWTNRIPTDPLPPINGALSQRYCSAAEIWGEFRDWLVKREVEAPEGIEPEPLYSKAQQNQ